MHVRAQADLARTASPPALEKAERYRLLNEPAAAESICLDVLAGRSRTTRRRWSTLLLALTDQFAERPAEGRATGRGSCCRGCATSTSGPTTPGIICERRAKAQLRPRRRPASGELAYDWLREAMELYEQAEAQRPAGNDDAILRWNTCARLLARSGLPGPRTRRPPSRWYSRSKPVEQLPVSTLHVPTG